MTAAAAAVELSPETIAELTPPCEINQHKCSTPGPCCECPPEARRPNCMDAARWALHIAMRCGHSSLALACDVHQTLIASWLRDPHQGVLCKECGAILPPRLVVWDRL